MFKIRKACVSKDDDAAAAASSRTEETDSKSKRGGIMNFIFGEKKEDEETTAMMYAENGQFDPINAVQLLERKRLKKPAKLFTMKDAVPFKDIIAPEERVFNFKDSCVFDPQKWIITRRLGVASSSIVLAVTPRKYELDNARFLAMKLQVSSPEEARSAKQELIVLEALMGMLPQQKGVSVTKQAAPFVKLYDYGQCAIDMRDAMLAMQPNATKLCLDAPRLLELRNYYEKLVDDTFIKYMMIGHIPRRKARQWLQKSVKGYNNEEHSETEFFFRRHFDDLYYATFFDRLSPIDGYEMESSTRVTWSMQIQEACDTDLVHLFANNPSLRAKMFTDEGCFAAIFAQQMLTLDQFNTKMHGTHWDAHGENWLVTKEKKDVGNTYVKLNRDGMIWLIPLFMCDGYVLKLHDFGRAHIELGSKVRTLGRIGLFPGENKQIAYMLNSNYCPQYDVFRVALDIFRELILYLKSGYSFLDVNSKVLATLTKCFHTVPEIAERFQLYGKNYANEDPWDAYVTLVKTLDSWKIAKRFNVFPSQQRETLDDLKYATRYAGAIMLPSNPQNDITPARMLINPIFERFIVGESQMRTINEGGAVIIDMTLAPAISEEKLRHIVSPKTWMTMESGMPLPQGKNSDAHTLQIAEQATADRVAALALDRFAYAFSVGLKRIMAHEESPFGADLLAETALCLSSDTCFERVVPVK